MRDIILSASTWPCPGLSPSFPLLNTAPPCCARSASPAPMRSSACATGPWRRGFRASLVTRLGGDEFCVVLPAASLTEAERFAHAASGRIARELRPDISLCWGAAPRDSHTRTGHELIAAADAALLEAKRLGPGHLRLRAPGDRGRPAGVARRRASAPSGRRATDDWIPRFVGLLDQIRPSTTRACAALLLRRDPSQTGRPRSRRRCPRRWPELWTDSRQADSAHPYPPEDRARVAPNWARAHRRQHDAVIEDSDDEDDDEITIVATGGDLARIQQESAPMPSPRKPGCTGRVGHCRAVQSRSRSPA